MPKKLRFLSAYLTHYLKKYAALIIAGVVFGSIVYIQRNNLILAYQSLAQSQTNLGIEGIYTSGNLPSKITNQVSYGLTTITENNKEVPSPIIAKMEVSENNLAYIFTFKNNLIWQNGKKFRASDLDINIPATTVQVISPTVIKITVSASFSPLLSALSKPLFLKDTLIGLGNFKVANTSFQDGNVKVLQLTSTNSNRQNIVYHFYSNSSDLYTAFKLGEVDEISATAFDSQLDGWPKIKINPSISTSEYLAIFLNTQNISSKQNRQALAYATPKTDDKNKRCLGPISPNSWAYNPQVKQYNFNPTRAKELFEKDNNSQLDFVVADRRLLSQAEVIKKSWEEILGIKVNLNIITDNIDSASYDALLTFSLSPSDPDQYPLWHSTQSNTNVTHLNNSRIDKLLEEGRQVQDQFERKKIYSDFQKFLLEESPAIFLEYPTTYAISRIK